MPKTVAWNSTKRDHGPARRELAALAAFVESHGGRQPGSSGDGEMTVYHRRGGETVYVRRYRQPVSGRPGICWRIGNDRMRKSGFVYCTAFSFAVHESTHRFFSWHDKADRRIHSVTMFVNRKRPCGL